jgi:hypothetical protein
MRSSGAGEISLRRQRPEREICIMASNRIDPVAKTMAQQLLAFPIPVSAVLASALSND